MVNDCLLVICWENDEMVVNAWPACVWRFRSFFFTLLIFFTSLLSSIMLIYLFPSSPGYNEVNNVAARMLCHLTASARFHGDMNVDLNEIYTNLIPFPKLQFLMTALSLRVNAAPPVGSGLSGSGKAPSGVSFGVRANNDSMRVILQRAFHDILTARGQITAGNPSEKGECWAANRSKTFLL